MKACLNVVKEGEAATDDPTATPSPNGDRALSLRIVGQARLIESDEQSRMLVSGMTAELTSGSATVRVPIHDVSESGLGLIVDQSVATGIQVELQLETPAGTVHRIGTVVYSRPSGDGARVGVALEEMSRIDGSRWRKLLGVAA